MPFGVLPPGKTARDVLPDDLTGQYNTPLTPEQAKAYEAWRATLPQQLQNTRDYDLQGAYLDSVVPSGNLHLTDKFKKPNHPTFSSGSQYSTPDDQGGQWVDLTPQAPDDQKKWAFAATPDNFRHQTPDMLAAYMAQNEPGNALKLPQGGAAARVRRGFGYR